MPPVLNQICQNFQMETPRYRAITRKMVSNTRRVSSFLVFFLYVLIQGKEMNKEKEEEKIEQQQTYEFTSRFIIILLIRYINTLQTTLSQTPTTPPNPNLYHTQSIFIKH